MCWVRLDLQFKSVQVRCVSLQKFIKSTCFGGTIDEQNIIWIFIRKIRVFVFMLFWILIPYQMYGLKIISPVVLWWGIWRKGEQCIGLDIEGRKEAVGWRWKACGWRGAWQQDVGYRSDGEAGARFAWPYMCITTILENFVLHMTENPWHIKRFFLDHKSIWKAFEQGDGKKGLMKMCLGKSHEWRRQFLADEVGQAGLKGS